MTNKSIFTESRLAAAVFLFAATALALYIRMLPVLNNNGVDFQWDAAFNYRMCETVSREGRLPDVDHLRLYPQGIKIRETMPVFLYYGFGVFDKVAKVVCGIQDLKMRVLYYNALCGALICIPVFLAVRALAGGMNAAFAAAFMASVIPIGLRRTFATYFRGEVLGVLLIMFCFAFFLRALRSGETRRLRCEAAVSGVFLFLAIGTWRVPVLYFVLLTAGVLVFLIRGKDTRRLAHSYLVLAAAYVFCCFALGYLRAQAYIVAPESVFVLMTAAFAAYLIRIEGTRETTLQERLKTAAAGGVVLALFVIFHKYDVQESLMSTCVNVLSQAMSRFGFTHTMSADARLFGNAKELEPMSILWLARGDYMSAAMPLFAGYFYAVYRRRAQHLDDACRFLVFFLLTWFLVLTLFVASRNMTLVAPFACIAIGGFIQDIIDWIRARNADEEKRRGRLTVLYAALAFVLTTLAMDSSYRMLILHYGSIQVAPNLKKVLGLFATNTPPNAVIWTDWQHAYPVQTYARRMTVMDGLFEVPENRRRVLEESRALWSANEEDLINFCRKYNASYILVARTKLPAAVMYLGLNWANYNNGREFTELGKRINLVRMFTDPQSMKDIKLLMQEQEFSIFYVPEIGERNRAPSVPSATKNDGLEAPELKPPLTLPPMELSPETQDPASDGKAQSEGLRTEN